MRVEALFGAEGNATFGQIVGGQLYSDAVTGQDADVVFAHATGDVAGHNMAVVQLDPEHSVRQGLDDRTLHLDVIFFRH